MAQKENLIIGVDIGSHAVKVCQIQQAGDGYRLLAVGSAAIPPGAVEDGVLQDPDEVAAAIVELFKNLKIKSKRVGISISGYSVIVKKINLEVMSDEELDDYISEEAEQYIPFDIDDVYLDYQVIRAGADEFDRSDVMLVAAKKDVIDDYLDMLQELKLLPVLVDVDGFALENIWETASESEDNVALVDIGASGPICGFVMAIVVSWFGLSSSRPVPPSEVPAGIMLGESIAFKVISRFAVGELPEGYDLELSPVAFAGWLGLFITALNLLPMGQLDGGHVIYALFGRKHRFVALGALLVILPLGTRWLGWLIWGILMVFMGLMKHPPPMDPYTPLDGRRKFIALLAIAIFIVSFIPVPFSGF